jgi:hypothetical protein
MDWELNERLKQQWTDKFVVVDDSRPELRRFQGIVGRVVTVNMNNRCIVDFQDGAWYDIHPDYLRICPDQEEARKKYDPKKNSAQPIPSRQA